MSATAKLTNIIERTFLKRHKEAYGNTEGDILRFVRGDITPSGLNGTAQHQHFTVHNVDQVLCRYSDIIAAAFAFCRGNHLSATTSMIVHGTVVFSLISVVLAQYPTLRDLVNPREQYALRDTLSALVEREYEGNVIGSDYADALPVPTQRAPSIAQLNRNYSDLLFQGDIRMPTSFLAEMVGSSNTRRKRTAFRNGQYPTTIWKNGVPFAFHKSLKPAGRRSVLAAIQFFRHHTCIRFRRRTKEPVYLLFTGHDEGCWSTVGRAAWQRQQIVSIGPGCEPFGVSSHEVAHALGLFHEQSRFDRDSWINIYPARIPRSLLYNFAKVTRKQMSTYGTSYDIGSVMHYTPFEFSKDPSVPSMVAVNINEQASMGQLAGPSFNDIVVLNKHYSCGTRCRKKIQCFNGGMQNPNNCRRCKCPLGYGGRFCGSLASPSIRRCGRKLYATMEPKRIRVKIVAAPRAAKPRTCIFHIISPANTRIHFTVEKVTGTCTPGCWREAAEFKVRADKRITGDRFCCAVTSKKRVLSNTPVVPFVLKGIRKTAEITFIFRSVPRTSSREDIGEDEYAEEESVVFGTPERTVGGEFEIELQSPLREGETPPESTEEPAHDGDGSETVDEDLNNVTDELPDLDEDLEAMVDDNDFVEIEPIS
ncbi:Zinc metalloproteinase [Trichostrongylus colubriformis]|uniref:Metalloendopeptidase n=1 Tax=Trichostrongylus colubriformis TaxID=6319 RepID=A0AAN8ILJ7_TRICO